ncbi:hypothetical protein BDZ91DRAFT_768456 [Kalaharituber pfeilii]|nr:hypothetical protein BDZ91DRAFT_768456 [Kalaharituber pfeilii]
MSTEIYTTLPHATSSSALAHSMDSSQKHGFTNADEWTGHGSVGKTFKRVILILGLSGTGKTSFIRSVTEDETVMVNDSMVGRIEKVRGYPATIDGKTFTLVEPPAFDIDFTSAGDWEQVVKDLCMWLQDVNKQLSSPIEITGILYFHRISDDRIAGSSKRALRLLQALCGKNYMRNVRLVTTHWDMVTQDVGEAREQELKSEYWREMLDDGAETVPFQGEKDQGLNILSQLVQKHGDAKLQIQRELLEEGKQWEETQAAAALNSHLESALKKKTCIRREFTKFAGNYIQAAAR